MSAAAATGPAEKPSEKYQKASKLAKALAPEVHYTVDEKQKSILITEDGYEAAEDVLQVSTSTSTWRQLWHQTSPTPLITCRIDHVLNLWSLLCMCLHMHSSSPQRVSPIAVCRCAASFVLHQGVLVGHMCDCAGVGLV